jgi:hypothetical protein
VNLVKMQEVTEEDIVRGFDVVDFTRCKSCPACKYELFIPRENKHYVRRLRKLVDDNVVIQLEKKHGAVIKQIIDKWKTTEDLIIRPGILWGILLLSIKYIAASLMVNLRDDFDEKVDGNQVDEYWVKAHTVSGREEEKYTWRLVCECYRPFEATQLPLLTCGSNGFQPQNEMFRWYMVHVHAYTEAKWSVVDCRQLLTGDLNRLTLLHGKQDWCAAMVF